MPRVSPFIGLLYDRTVVGPLDAVTSPPYDMVSPEARRRNLDATPFHISRVELGREGASEADYLGARDALRSWEDTGALVRTRQPAFYAYEMRFRFAGHPRSLRGIIAAVDVEDWGGSILPHERTMPGPVDDRLLLLRATRTNVSCIEVIVPGPVRSFGDLWASLGDRAPDADAVDEEGVEHRLWVVPEAPGLADELEATSALIADGHHRYTTALRYRDERRAQDPTGPWDAAMMLIVDGATEHPPVLPYHRAVATSEAGTPEGLRRVRDLAEVVEGVDDEALTCGYVARTQDGIVHGLVRLEGTPPAVVALDPMIGETARTGLFVHDAFEAEEMVRTGRAEAAWILPPTTVERVRDVVDRGERMPEKSTYFWPKPRTGLVMRPLD